MKETGSITELDRQIACALQISGRASWARIAGVLGVSERTVARRAQPLLDDGTIRLIGTIDTRRIGWGDPILLRMRCEMGGTRRLAEWLAERSDTRTAMVTCGSADCFAEVVPRDLDALQDLILQQLPELGVVTGCSTYSVLRFFTAAHEWHAGLLAPDQVAALRPVGLPQFAEPDSHEPLREGEAAVVHALAADGRVPTGVLASRLGLSPATASRRVESLLRRGVVRVRAEVKPSLFGLTTEALLWLQVRPRHIETVGLHLASHPGVRTLIAVNGDFQMFAHVVVSGRRALYDFLTGTLGSLEGIRDVEVTDVIDTVKRGGLLLHDLSVKRSPPPARSGPAIRAGRRPAESSPR
jgi:DNA-binding Lrp family transcriptional regulator